VIWSQWLVDHNLLEVIFLAFFLCRVWFLYQGQTMNLGAKVWMDWLLDLLNTTSKVLDLPSGKLFLVSFLRNFVVDNIH